MKKIHHALFHAVNPNRIVLTEIAFYHICWREQLFISEKHAQEDSRSYCEASLYAMHTSLNFKRFCCLDFLYSNNETHTEIYENRTKHHEKNYSELFIDWTHHINIVNRNLFRPDLLLYVFSPQTLKGNGRCRITHTHQFQAPWLNVWESSTSYAKEVFQLEIFLYMYVLILEEAIGKTEHLKILLSE